MSNMSSHKCTYTLATLPIQESAFAKLHIMLGYCHWSISSMDQTCKLGALVRCFGLQLLARFTFSGDVSLPCFSNEAALHSGWRILPWRISKLIFIPTQEASCPESYMLIMPKSSSWLLWLCKSIWVCWAIQRLFKWSVTPDIFSITLTLSAILTRCSWLHFKSTFC